MIVDLLFGEDSIVNLLGIVTIILAPQPHPALGNITQTAPAKVYLVEIFIIQRLGFEVSLTGHGTVVLHFEFTSIFDKLFDDHADRLHHVHRLESADDDGFSPITRELLVDFASADNADV